MPTDKDFKRLVRARMARTGEAYTTARAHLLDNQLRKATPPAKQPALDYAKLAGMSDITIKAKTGCTWERWLWALDRVGAHQWSHREIAAYVREKYDVPSWWTQTVTVGYERIKGLRAIGQRRGGEYQASKSKTFGVPVGRLYRAFRDARTRRRWLDTVGLTVRSAVPGKSMRVTWPDGTSVELYFAAKGAAKSQVAVQHRKLPDKPSAERMKGYWADRLGSLHQMLNG
ncbi:MAG: hypothetical protein H0T50_08245 [Gemmatimonadales bacterium]|nr:hypothetical protein [Gemmatimonadales bacterium]